MPAPASATSRIDPLSDVLRKVRLTGALFFIVDASDPWGVEVPPVAEYASIVLPGAQHVVSYHIILEGEGWVVMPEGVQARFAAGDILLIAHGDPHRLLSAPDQALEFDGPATVAFLREMAAGRLPFVIAEGGGGAARTRYVCGYLGCDTRPFNPVLAALPPLLHIRRQDDGRPDLLARLIDLTLEEAQCQRAGGEGLRLRLSELLFVEVLRRHLASGPANGSGWLGGLADPAVGRALGLLHGEPQRAWTLEALAKGAGLSRTVLAARFARLVGCPPMQYLMLWRMQLAARLLADRSMTVAAVAHSVGYESEAAFSRAFKKTSGVPPASWRRGGAASASRSRALGPVAG
jgi:AraC-like DNA-binding protein/mannose-6-phosphate isomerase-like protein (cupin superfamily)